MYNMALSDSMFLFELVINNIKSYLSYCEDFKIIGQFTDIFNITLKTPIEVPSKRPRKVKPKQKHKVRSDKTQILKPLPKIKTKIGQSILIINEASQLISIMNEYPLEISLYKKSDTKHKIGSTLIPWNQMFIDYLKSLRKKRKHSPALVEGEYNVYDEINSKRIATLDMSVKLTYFSDRIISQFRSISEEKPDTFIYSLMNSKPISVISTVKNPNKSINNTIKRSSLQYTNDHVPLIYDKKINAERVLFSDKQRICNEVSHNAQVMFYLKKIKSSTYIDDISNKSKLTVDGSKSITKSKSCILSDSQKNNNFLHYIFGDPQGKYGNQVYCVGYFTVEKDSDKDSSKNDQNLSKVSSDIQNSENSSEPKKKFKFKKCDSECRIKMETGCSESVCSVDLPEEAAHLISVTKCKEVECNFKRHRELPSPPDERILLDLTSLKKECCETEVTEKIEDIVGGITAKMQLGHDPCYCTCECRFGFTKKTTYCKVCGGYEIAGEELARKPAQDMPIPCPIFHKLVDKNKLKTWSTSGSDSKKRGDDKGMKATAAEKRLAVTDKKSVESEKDSKKGKKKKKDERFQFNYGYKGIPPQIGHSKCALPCTGTLSNVPKNMGWLWTADNIPGMKFRPNWKPGATNKHVVRLLKMARNPGEVISKKKRKELGKKKRPLKRPLLVVHKKDGEYTVTMETMKTYQKPRAINQQPYEDKPVITYTIGRTDDENRERQKKKQREQRRLERAQRQFIQSAFRDMCHEICLKTYQQALGILSDTEDPECTCYPALPTTKVTNMDVSCSCSEDKSYEGSDTDSDEWIVEFTPPNATFDPTFKGKKVMKADNGSQYTYLDYRVKLVDRFGIQVPRFFKGPDGKQQCSDLGGFWSPDHKWLEINIDGYVAPDGRWAPNSFLGPSGEHVDAETGKFQNTNGQWLVVGVDGFIDNQGRWRYYPKPSGAAAKRRLRGTSDSKKAKKGDKAIDKTVYKSEASWSCFGDADPKDLSKLGIVGHGGDRKLLITTLKDMLSHGENVKIPQPTTVFRLPPSKKTKRGQKRGTFVSYEDRTKCKHPVPSEKGIIAVDGWGNKTYFRLRDQKNKRPAQRMANLAKQGISLSSFHVPCFHSFINSEIMKQQQRERLYELAGRTVAVQAS